MHQQIVVFRLCVLWNEIGSNQIMNTQLPKKYANARSSEANFK